MAVIALATGEETANEIARDAGEIRMVGEAVRWIDLAATRNGAGDIFDRIPKKVSKAERAQWVEKRCAMIRAGCRRNHGVTIEQFIEQVIRKRKTVQKDAHYPCGRNLSIVSSGQKMIPPSGTWQNVSVTSTRLGSSVPARHAAWSAKTVRKCIERCYRDARRELNTETTCCAMG